MRPARIWSLPPADPPPQEIDAGRSLNAVSSSCSERYGDAAGTAITWYSPVSLASGVASPRVTGDPFVTMPPSMMRPETSTASPLPRSAPMKRASPIVPAAPGMFSTGADRAMPVCCSTCCITRAVWSHPPPGAAGAITRSWLYGDAWSGEPLAEDCAAAVLAARTRSAARQAARRISVVLGLWSLGFRL